MGGLAIEAKRLGIGLNDPMAHLERYHHEKEKAVTAIEMDLVTDIAERLKKTPFINYVDFNFTGTDFISAKDKVSMKSMTGQSLQILSAEYIHDHSLAAELDRAKTEAQEVSKLANWFASARIGAYLVFESLPIGEREKYAIPRIYRKVSENSLQGCFVSLHSSSITQFNQLRRALGTGESNCKNEAEILKNHYEFYDPEVDKAGGGFIDYYVNTYDELLRRQTGQQHNFGLSADGTIEKQNGITKVRDNSNITAWYLRTIKALSDNNGRITPELIQINSRLNLGFDLEKGQTISVSAARELLIGVRTYIASTIDQADKKTLEKIKEAGADSDIACSTMSHFGGAAVAAGETYDGSCSTVGRSENNMVNNSETSMLHRDYRIRELPADFGDASEGICRTPNCPSHGNSIWFDESTTIGGCGFCLTCHPILARGDDPQYIYSLEKLKIKQDEAEELRKQKYSNKPIEKNSKPEKAASNNTVSKTPLKKAA